MSHTHAARAHAKRRLRERYNIDANRFEIAHMILDIRMGRCPMVARQSNTRSIHKCRFRDQDVYAVYSTTAKTILTFLTEEQIHELSPDHADASSDGHSPTNDRSFHDYDAANAPGN